MEFVLLQAAMIGADAVARQGAVVAAFLVVCVLAVVVAAFLIWPRNWGQ